MTNVTDHKMTCLKCGKQFVSKDKARNRICKGCNTVNAIVSMRYDIKSDTQIRELEEKYGS